MATAIDFEGERRAIQRALMYAIRERDQEAAKVRDGVGNVAHLEAMRAKVRLHQDELAEIDGATALAAEERAARAEEKRLQLRAADARSFLAHRSNAISAAESIDGDLPFSKVGEAVDAVRLAFAEANELWLARVDEKNELRGENRQMNIRQAMAFGPIEGWLHAAAHGQGLAPYGGPLTADYLKTSLTELVCRRFDAARAEAATKELPELREKGDV
jgi:hypothetical protein